MDEQKLWWIIEFVTRDLNLPYSILNCLLLSLPFPPSAPPHISRLFLLRRLLSLTASHRPINTLKTLKTLDLLLHLSPSPPPISLCDAYSSLLYYISLSRDVSSSDVASSVDRISNYEFCSEILGRYRSMLARVDGNGGCAIDCVISARNKAIEDLKEFVEEEFRVMGPPFLMRAAEEWSIIAEAKNDANEAPSRNSDKEATQKENGISTSSRTNDKYISFKKYLEQNENMSKDKEKDQVDNKKRKISEVNWLNITRSCAKKLEENKYNSKRKLNGENGAQRDVAGTSGTGTKQIDVPVTNEQNQDRTKGRNRENDRVENVNDPCTSHANITNNKEKKQSLMDRNPTAHTFEWDEWSEDARELERNTFCTRRATNNNNSKSYKRRQVLRWGPHEEQALRKAVKEIGKGNWKEILYRYPDEFIDRTEVDLKDKWRNMSRS